MLLYPVLFHYMLLLPIHSFQWNITFVPLLCKFSPPIHSPLFTVFKWFVYTNIQRLHQRSQPFGIAVILVLFTLNKDLVLSIKCDLNMPTLKDFLFFSADVTPNIFRPQFNSCFVPSIHFHECGQNIT